MAIGLGWHPGVLGRSKELTEFIRHGQDEAMVEMVLRWNPEEDSGEKFAEFVVVRRHFAKKSSKSFHSEFYLNDEQTTAQRIKELMRSLNIHVDNLCQFLPQDRVSEFARLSPVDLLVETEKAAASPCCLQQHEQLISTRRQVREVEQILAVEQATHAQLTAQNQALDRMIAQIQERDARRQRVALCKQKRPWIQYGDARKLFVECRQDYDSAKRAYDQHNAAADPMRRQLAAAEKDETAKKKVRDAARASGRNSVIAAQSALKRVRELHGDIEQKRGEIMSLRRRRQSHQQVIAETKAMLRAAEENLKNRPRPPPFEEAPFRQRESVVKKEISELAEKHAEIRSRQQDLRLDSENCHKHIDAATRKLSQSQDVQASTFRGLERFFKSAAEAYLWIQRSKSRFRKPVIGPLCMEIPGVRDGMGALIENVMARPQLCNQFFCYDREDFDTVMNELVQSQSLEINVSLIEVDSPDSYVERVRSAVDVAKRMGFSGVALDFINSTDRYLLAALCESTRLHAIPVANKPVKHDCFRDAGFASAFSKYVTSEGRFELKRNRYRPGDDVVNTHVLSRAYYLVGPASVVTEEDAALTAKIGKLKSVIRANEASMRDLLSQESALKDRIDVADARLQGIQEEREAARNALHDYREQQMAVKRRQDEVKRLMAEKFEEDPHKAVLKALIEEAAASVPGLAAVLAKSFDAVSVPLAHELRVQEAQRLVSQLRLQLMEHVSQCNAAKELMENARKDMDLAEEAARRYLDAAKQGPPLDAAVEASFAQLPDSLRELDTLIAQEEALLQFSDRQDLNPRALQDYETRRSQLESLGQTIAERQAQMARLNAQLSALRQAWVPAVKAMVAEISARFSELFAQAKNVGEVQLIEHGDDFDQWEIAVMVKFREAEQLQRLSHQRQSGGEKSMSTMLYLLSMQGQSRSPFRVVDEINQGLDASNERIVHNLVVTTAVSKCSSQYFLVTPKLLPDLTYIEDMHVLCVYSGPIDTAANKH